MLYFFLTGSYKEADEMTTKQKLADLLEKAEGEFLSGNLLAEKLGVTRAAVWKNIR